MLNHRLKIAFWWLCLVIAPLALVSIELFHPAGFTVDPGMFQYLSKPEPHSEVHKALYYFGPQWWFILHMIQTPLVCLVAIGMWLLLASIHDDHGPFAVAGAWLSRASTFLFMIYYTVLDAIGGIGLGRTLEITNALASASEPYPRINEEQLMAVELVLNSTWTDPWVGGVGSIISETGSWAILLSTIFAVFALYKSGKLPLPPLVLLLFFGYELQVSHASYHGPIAFFTLAVTALWIWTGYRKQILG